MRRPGLVEGVHTADGVRSEGKFAYDERLKTMRMLEGVTETKTCTLSGKWDCSEIGGGSYLSEGTKEMKGGGVEEGTFELVEGVLCLVSGRRKKPGDELHTVKS